MVSEEQKVALKKAGIDFDTTLERFCDNQDMYVRFLKKFEEDRSYEKAVTAFENANYVDLLEQVHALKGLSGNLGIDCVYDICNDIVIELRADRKDDIEALMSRLESEYKTAIISVSEL